MKKYLYSCFGLAVLFFMYGVFISIESSNIYSSVSKYLHMIRLFAACSDWYYDDNGDWPMNLESILEKHPVLSKEVTDLGIYEYIPYSSEKGYGEVKYSISFIIENDKHKDGLLNLSLRFPEDVHTEWNDLSEKTFREFIIKSRRFSWLYPGK